MTKYQGLVFRFILFLFGAGIIFLSFFLINGDKELTGKDAFIWTSIGIMYIFVFMPFLYSSVNTKNFSAKIPSLTMVWTGIFLYIAASIAVIFLLSGDIISLNAAIIIQAVLLFIYMINVYFEYFASSHVKSVAEEEDDKKYYLTKIKSKAGVLLLSVNKLSPVYENTQKVLIKSINDIKYVSPVNNDMGSELEANILRSINLLCELIGNIQEGANNSSLEKEADKLQSLVNERKLLRN